MLIYLYLCRIHLHLICISLTAMLPFKFSNFLLTFSKVLLTFSQNFHQLFPKFLLTFSRIFTNYFPKFFTNLFPKFLPTFSRIFTNFFLQFSLTSFQTFHHFFFFKIFTKLCSRSFTIIFKILPKSCLRLSTMKCNKMKVCGKIKHHSQTCSTSRCSKIAKTKPLNNFKSSDNNTIKLTFNKCILFLNFNKYPLHVLQNNI